VLFELLKRLVSFLAVGFEDSEGIFETFGDELIERLIHLLV
jgi:hypothetical protein